MKKKFLLVCLIIGALAITPFVANATLTTYADRASFNAAFSGTTLIDFEWIASTLGWTYLGATFTDEDVTFTQGDSRLFIFDENYPDYNTSGLSSDYLNNNGLNYNGSDSQPVIINFASDVYGVGLDIGWLYSYGDSGNVMEFVLNNGESFSSSVIGPLFNTNTPLGFLGFSSDNAFSSITINDPSNAVMIDNFTYSTSRGNPVPEPSTMLLLGVGLVCFAGFSRRKLKK